MKNKTCCECRYYKPYNDAICPYTHRMVMPPMTRMCSRFEPPTNGDVIRQMSNEELAELFALYCMCDTCPLKYVECVGDGETERTYAHCYDKFNAYLNAPAESEGENE